MNKLRLNNDGAKKIGTKKSSTSIEMNPMVNRVGDFTTSAKGNSSLIINGRPFGGKNAAEESMIRNKSGTGEIELGVIDEPISKHEKYKRRQEEENDGDAKLSPHVARAAGFNSYTAGNHRNEGMKRKKKASEMPPAPPPPPTNAKGDDAPPKPEWVRKFDNDSGFEYFEHRLTGESTWDKPKNYDGE